MSRVLQCWGHVLLAPERIHELLCQSATSCGVTPVLELRGRSIASIIAIVFI
jgi:hypothetical protein